jgi:hypothetical protein
MIIVQLSGGLGNQMFQYAAGYSLARRLGVECQVNLANFAKNIRKYELECFTDAPAVSQKNRIPRRWRPRIFGLTGGMTIFEEKFAFVFDERFSSLKDGTYLVGYFQSEKYFEGYATDIRTLYTLRMQPKGANQQILNDMLNTQTVSVHVRRGDYVSNRSTNLYHGICPAAYYQQAFELISRRVQSPRFYVFSDDPEWTRANVQPPGYTIYIEHNRDAAFEDLRLMSSCRNHIIANSSFSWWGAWLNSCPEKIVIAPRKWLANDSVPIIDLIPETWIQIETSNHVRE